MRNLFFLSLALAGLCSCSNSGEAKTNFCDTSCNSQPITVTSSDPSAAHVTISFDHCNPDTISWTHKGILETYQRDAFDFLGKDIKINKSALKVDFRDTTMAYLSFNDCETGRGYLLKLPYVKGVETQKVSGALTSFDKKFFIEDGLVAYTDRGNLYAEDVHTGKRASFTLGKEFDIDFDKIHESIDSVHINHEKGWIRLKDKGQEVVKEGNFNFN